MRTKIKYDEKEYHQKQRMPAGNSTYPKGGVTCSKDRFIVAESLVLRMKFSAKSPALRVAVNL